VNGTSADVTTDQTILIVDDHPQQLQFLGDVLTQSGYEVHRAFDGAEGLEMALEHRPHLIVCDVVMPRMDGITMCREVRQHPELRDTPVLLMSGIRTDSENVVDGFRAGADDYLERPFDPLRLVARVARLLERRRAAQAVKESEGELRALFAAMADVVLVLDEHGRYLKIAPTNPRVLYKPSEETIGRTLHEVFSTEQADMFLEHIRRALAEGRPHSFEYSLQIQGEDIWFDASVSPLPNRTVFLVARDITERRQAETALRMSEERFRALVENNWDAIVVTDRDLVIRFASESTERVTGVPAANVIGSHGLACIHPDDLDAVRCALDACLAQPGTRVSIKYRAQHADGTWRHREGSIVNRLDDPAIRGLISNYRDTTEREGAEAALRRTTQRLMAVLSSLPIALWTVDAAGVVTLAEGKLLARLGVVPAEIVGRPISDLYGHVPDILDATRLVLAGESPSRTFELSDLTLEARYVPKRGADGTIAGAIGVAIDVTERAGLERQLRQSQKMEAVGRLAAGVAHDFNNLLTAIVGFSELTLAELGPDDRNRSDIEQVLSAGRSAASLTRQLLAFSRQQILQPQVLDLNGIVSRMQSLLKRTIGEDVELVTRPLQGLDRVSADPGQIEQVIMNLAINARDAMPGGGHLTIETANVHLDASYAAAHQGASPGPHVMLAVSDTGIGMSDDVQAHVFEPFYTTKPRGQGTGLGLATVYGIVKQSGGSIWLYSEEGQGTTFKIYLPRAERTNDEPLAAPLVRGVPVGNETILLVEDQAEVRSVARAALTRQGYTVIEATRGDEALDIVLHDPAPIDLLLTDVVMPGMNGRALASLIVAQRPAIRVIYTSGYTEHAIVDHGVLEMGVAFIQKPFSPEGLLRKVREVLDAG
jgi:PAS domain S-box-containing protein